MVGGWIVARVRVTRNHGQYKVNEYVMLSSAEASKAEEDGWARVLDGPKRSSGRGSQTPQGPLETKEDP